MLWSIMSPRRRTCGSHGSRWFPVTLQSYKKISPFFIPYAITNMGSALVAIDQGFMGPNYSISTACATANYAFQSASQHIRNGEADVMIAGGSEAPIIPVGLGGFVACRYAHARCTWGRAVTRQHCAHLLLEKLLLPSTRAYGQLKHEMSTCACVALQGAVEQQREHGGREPAVGQGPRRLRDGRGRGRARDGVARARAGAPCPCPASLWLA
jgi:Beta-ketoacyl synthase, N-terminal domain